MNASSFACNNKLDLQDEDPRSQDGFQYFCEANLNNRYSLPTRVRERPIERLVLRYSNEI